jgi:phage/plasmid-like protein (TIGR03299 family)
MHGITDTDQTFTVGEQAWHNLDKNVKGRARLTADEARTFLDWKVEKAPAYYDDKPVPGAFFTIRTDTNMVLGAVGSMYSVIQNDWLFKPLKPLIDDGACVYETGGSILGGRKVWALAKFPGEHYIAADDRIQDYILVTIAHDGSLPFTAMHTSVRVVCQNTLSMAHSMGSEYPIVRIKHTPATTPISASPTAFSA